MVPVIFNWTTKIREESLMDMLLIIAKKHGFYHNNGLISCKWMNVEKNVQKNVVVFGTQFRQFIFSFLWIKQKKKKCLKHWWRHLFLMLAMPFICSKSTMEKPEQWVESVQRYHEKHRSNDLTKYWCLYC